MKPGFTLPPLMFTIDEIEALVLGSRWVSQRGGERLGAAARDALAKIGDVLPAALRHELDSAALLVGPATSAAGEDEHLAVLREAIRNEHKLRIAYRDTQGAESARTIWPFALGFFDRAQVLVAWCELRGDIRHFRIDRIADVAVDAQRYPRRRQVLLRDWRAREGIPAPR